MPRIYLNGVNLYYEVSGAGPSVMLCHGYTGSHRSWMSQISALSPKYQTVAIDHRGHGDSGAPSSAEDYSVPILVNDVRALLNHLGITRCCLVGHSLGGFMAIQLVLDYPDIISSLILVDTSSGPSYVPGMKELGEKLNEIARRDGMAAAFEYNTQQNPLVQRRFEKYPALREVARHRMLETSVDAYVYLRKAMAEREDLTPRLGEISVPTLVIVGELDTPYHQPSEVMTESIHFSRLQVVPQAFHNPHEETPEVLNELLLNFLAELY
ncbi:alpha/beta fold hydrolase [Chloroflexota bacterium]